VEGGIDFGRGLEADAVDAVLGVDLRCHLLNQVKEKQGADCGCGIRGGWLDFLTLMWI
jgi:hypothetical protein